MHTLQQGESHIWGTKEHTAEKEKTNQSTTFIVEASDGFSFSYAAVAQPSHSNMSSSSFLQKYS